MELALLAASAFVSLVGVVGIVAALCKPNAKSARIMRLICGSRIEPTKQLALPLSSMLFFVGLVMALISWRGAPTWLLVVLMSLGLASSIVFQLRR